MTELSNMKAKGHGLIVSALVFLCCGSFVAHDERGLAECLFPVCPSLLYCISSRSPTQDLWVLKACLFFGTLQAYLKHHMEYALGFYKRNIDYTNHFEQTSKLKLILIVLR